MELPAVSGKQETFPSSRNGGRTSQVYNRAVPRDRTRPVITVKPLLGLFIKLKCPDNVDLYSHEPSVVPATKTLMSDCVYQKLVCVDDQWSGTGQSSFRFHMWRSYKIDVRKQELELGWPPKPRPGPFLTVSSHPTMLSVDWKWSVPEDSASGSLDKPPGQAKPKVAFRHARFLPAVRANGSWRYGPREETRFEWCWVQPGVELIPLKQWRRSTVVTSKCLDPPGRSRTPR
ncbi:hypothetical protein RRG08_040911 [Elysia crispata]|uniref:Uncharacterized protein n=1 Tax=Elysia crispata TaxID=231223 RepID=A0AAE0ZRK4_9GAST|nr:hypothetical protein RRG08_040911 [Elysia crispata]